MKKLTRPELEKARLLKAVRANIRLKHTLEADAEINEKLPEIEAAIDRAIAAGTVYELDIRSVLEDEA